MASAQDLVNNALNAIQEGTGEGTETTTSETGDVMSIEDITGSGKPLDGVVDGVIKNGRSSPADEAKKAGGTQTPKTTEDASTETTEAENEAVENEVDPLDEQYKEFGRNLLQEWQENPASVAADFFRNMSSEQQQAFIKAVAGGKAKTQVDLPRGYQPQGELEEALMPMMDDLSRVPELFETVPQLAQQVSNVTEAVTNNAEMFNFVAGHAHILEAKLNAVLNFIGMQLPDIDIQKVIDNTRKNKTTFKATVDKMTKAEFEKAINSKTQASKKRPLDTSGDASDIKQLKPGMKAVDILKLLEAG